MKERPILFSTEMVKAILAEGKTQTRRTTGLKIPNQNPSARMSPHNVGFNNWHFYYHDGGSLHPIVKCPYGQIGDVLWVRETWTPLDTQEVDSTELDEDGIALEEFQVEIGYKDGMSKWCAVSESFYDQMNEDIEDMEQEGTQWKPSIHMPKDAARIWLRITNVRVERLHAISEEDAIKEGIDIFWKKEINGFEIIESKSITTWSKYRSDAFKSLWKSINGYNSWNMNPWVWVIEFERIEKP